MNARWLSNLKIDDEDIDWAENAMGDAVSFDESRRNIIKSLDTVDIQAFPGTGKTTVLVAKLAILVKKWELPYSGICVLSHTNVAREEIEKRIGNITEGKRILAYPHFVGTLQSFFDTYVVLPYLRSMGIKINMIGTGSVFNKRWGMLPGKTKGYLRYKSKMDTNIAKGYCCYQKAHQNVKLGVNDLHHDILVECIDESQKEGYFTYDELLFWAEKILNENPLLCQSICQRFPVLFIDEAQDTREFFWKLINMVWNNDQINILHQSYGDQNQAIFNSFKENDDNDSYFPSGSPLYLKDSRRFDEPIAKLVNTISVSNEEMNGTENAFTKKNVKNTIFLYSLEKISEVIDSFGKLILDTFTDEELEKNSGLGCHVIGMIHKKKKKDKFAVPVVPRGIYDYWSEYDSNKVAKDYDPEYFIDFYRRGFVEYEQTKEWSSLVFWIAKGLQKIINKIKGEGTVTALRNPLRGLENALPREQAYVLRSLMTDLLKTKADDKQAWNTLIPIYEKILLLFDIDNSVTVNQLLRWSEDEDKVEVGLSANGRNNYTYHCGDRMVKLEFGSIHSVKGRTHLATLVLETYYYEFNIKSLLTYLSGSVKPEDSIGKRMRQRLRCHYVAMSRAAALLCLAIPKDFVDKAEREELMALGWDIKIIE